MGRPLSELKGRTEEANGLARWLRKVTAGVPVRTLEETFHYSKAMWTDYRSGSKLIPGKLLDMVVDELVPEDMRERVRENGRRLRAAAEEAERRPAPQTTPAVPALPHSRAPMPAALAEVFLRLDDARLQQMEAMRKLAESEKRCTQLQDMVSFLQHQSIQLTEERDRALQEAREARDLQHALEQSEQFREQAEGHLQHARRAAQEAYDLRLAAEAKVATAQTQVRRTTSMPSGTGDLLPQPTGGGMELPPMERIADVLQAAQEQLAEQDEELDELRSQLGIKPSAQDRDVPKVVEGRVVVSSSAGGPPETDVVVHVTGPDNANNPVTSTDTAPPKEASEIVVALSTASSPEDLGRQLQVLRDRAQARLGLTGAHGESHIAEHVFGTSRAQAAMAVDAWLKGSSIPDVHRLVQLMEAMGATQAETDAFLQARTRVLLNKHEERVVHSPPTPGSTDDEPSPASNVIKISTASEIRPLEPPFESVSWRWYTGRSAVLGGMATLWAAFTAAVKADPGPAVWKLVLFAVIALVATIVVWFEFALSRPVRPMRLRVQTIQVAGVGTAALAGLTVPWLPHADLWGRWPADLIGLL
ncbi:hypothetical protein [Streptomyces exfoliatus]|uniref:hypothetical protein n=1 Tax=Streptomyces exfoliatus TaxID=1905 RepID=UPI003C2B54D1